MLNFIVSRLLGGGLASFERSVIGVRGPRLLCRGPRLLGRVWASFVGSAMGVRGLLGEGLENFCRATLLCRGLMLLGSGWAIFEILSNNLGRLPLPPGLKT